MKPIELKIKRLKEQGEIITKEKGNSMLPLIKSNQEHKLKSCINEDVSVGDIVFCKVKGKYYTHKVFAIDSKKGFLIGNNSGYKNGWTKTIFGKVTEIIKI